VAFTVRRTHSIAPGADPSAPITSTSSPSATAASVDLSAAWKAATSTASRVPMPFTEIGSSIESATMPHAATMNAYDSPMSSERARK